MTITFFAVRPMFAAVDRVFVNKAAFLSGLLLAYVPRKLNSQRSTHFYNVFSITAKLTHYESVQAFATLHSFLILSASFGERGVLLDFAKSVYVFSMLGFYPIGLFGLSARLFVLPLVFFFKLSFSNTKLPYGYDKSIN